jgi:hypothetical protein
MNSASLCICRRRLGQELTIHRGGKHQALPARKAARFCRFVATAD